MEKKVKQTSKFKELMKTFKYQWLHTVDWSLNKLLFPFRKLSHYHNQIMQINVEQLRDSKPLTPYGVLLDWLLDLGISGGVITIFLWTRGFDISWWYIPSAGLTFWLVLDFVGKLANKIRGD